MLNTQVLHINYRLRENKISKKTGCAPLECRLTISGQDADMSTDLKIPFTHWDPKAKQLSTTCPDYEKLQAHILNFGNRINLYFQILQIEHEYITPEMVRELYQAKRDAAKGTPPPKQHHTLLQAADSLIDEFEERVNERKKTGIKSEDGDSEETLKQWKSTKLKLIEYLAYIKTKKIPKLDKRYRLTPEQREEYLTDADKYDIPLNDIQPIFETNFRTYLTVTRSGVLQGLAADKQLKSTKQILTYAVEKKWLSRNPLENFFCRTKEKDVIPLSFLQVEILEQKTGLVDRLERVRDCFIFEIYTGFAFQDIEALNEENIYCEPITGILYLSKERGKTDIEEMVPILPPIARLLAKYKNDPYCIQNNVLMPVLSNSCYNGYLKELAIVCNLPVILHTHLARHTFAFIMLSFGVSLEILSKMMGHASIRSTQKYVKVNILMIINQVLPITEKMFNDLGQLNFYRKYTSPEYQRLYKTYTTKFNILTPEQQQQPQAAAQQQAARQASLMPHATDQQKAEAKEQTLQLLQSLQMLQTIQQQVIKQQQDIQQAIQQQQAIFQQQAA
ncbi:hypothetical protein DBR11_25920 [Pedobacter sp. HMWF019]|uniref:site-specific integrase n=1 Tax=Pedobacter sp. HMWF019 TaxID=2056856 RepID=UPI000D351437|nr:site-specific integrase [Pedobacter sp. HMWF019]PTS93105.1 hypothetical protein DBR11_25920 [Pedobacter sp. HMWF019]